MGKKVKTVSLIKRSFRALALLIVAYVMLAFLVVLPIDGVFMLQSVPSIFAFILAVSITMYFSSRIIDSHVRKNLVAVGGMIIFWSILRAGKYIAFEESESIARHIWYFYYIPMLMIPQFSFQASLSIGEPETKKTPLIQGITGIFSLLCILLVLTNDFHQLVFRFNPGFYNWDADYSHEPLFWVITAWNYLFLFFSVVVMFRKCQLSACKKLSWIPVIYVVVCTFGLCLLITDNLPKIWGNNFGQFPEIACFMLGGFWILSITIGLVPSNMGYGKLFLETSLAVSLSNLDYEVVYQSNSAASMTKNQLASLTPVHLDEDTIVHRKAVTGGFAYWQVDISELNRLNRELEAVKEMLVEEKELLRQENELREKTAKISEKTKVYDEIAVRVLPQSQRIAMLSEQAQEDKEDKEKFEWNMRLISIYAVYIKRISNMKLLATEGTLKIQELTLALGETSYYLNKAGIPASVSGNTYDLDIPAENIIAIYEQFEYLLEQALPNLKALDINMLGNILKLSFEGASLVLSEEFKGTVEIDDEITFIRLPIREEGEKR